MIRRKEWPLTSKIEKKKKRERKKWVW